MVSLLAMVDTRQLGLNHPTIPLRLGQAVLDPNGSRDRMRLFGQGHLCLLPNNTSIRVPQCRAAAHVNGIMTLLGKDEKGTRQLKAPLSDLGKYQWRPTLHQ